MGKDQRRDKGIIGWNADFGYIHVYNPGVGVFHASAGFYIQEMKKGKRTGKVCGINVPFVI